MTRNPPRKIVAEMLNKYFLMAAGGQQTTEINGRK